MYEAITTTFRDNVVQRWCRRMITFMLSQSVSENLLDDALEAT